MSVKIAPIFSEIKGQDKVCRGLSADLSAGQTDRSYLFCGPRGVGKTMVAMALAKARYCERGGCGKCDDCVKVEGLVKQGLHPTITLVAPAKVQTTVDQVREMMKKARLRAEAGKGRTYIIDDAASLNAEAANTLLKLIEEPPPHSAFILVAANREGVLPTLRSRCREIRFQNLPLAEMQELLMKLSGLSDYEARLEGALVGGSFPAGKERVELVPLRDQALAAFQLAEGQGVRGQIQGAEDLAEGGRERARQRLHLLYLWFRDLLLLKYLSVDDVFNLDRREELARGAERWGEKECLRVMEVLEKAKPELEANANQKLVFEVALGRIFVGG